MNSTDRPERPAPVWLRALTLISVLTTIAGTVGLVLLVVFHFAHIQDRTLWGICYAAALYALPGGFVALMVSLVLASIRKRKLSPGRAKAVTS